MDRLEEKEKFPQSYRTWAAGDKIGGPAQMFSI